MKFIVLGLVVFIVYRFMAKPGINGPSSDSISESENGYSEYEEID